jgi:opacity protein-like surface antigen
VIGSAAFEPCRARALYSVSVMRRFASLAAVASVALAAAPARANEPAPPRSDEPDTGAFAAGVRLGASSASLSFPAIPADGALLFDTTSRYGVVAGAFAAYTVYPALSIQAEVSYAQQGAHFAFEDGTESTLALSYLHVPLLLRLDIDTPGRLTPYILAGPGLAILLSAEDRRSDVEFDRTDVTSPLDFVAVVGLGVWLHAPGGAAGIEARLAHGFVTIDRDDSDTRDDIDNRMLSVSVTYAVTVP